MKYKPHYLREKVINGYYGITKGIFCLLSELTRINRDRMAVITFKCSDQEKEAFQRYCDKRGVGVSEMLRELINDASGNAPDKVSIINLDERLKALESKFKSLSRESVSTPKKQRSTPPPTGDKVTIEQASEITGYLVSTLSSKFSREGIQAVDRVDGNRAGLYSKSEILDKIGKK